MIPFPEGGGRWQVSRDGGRFPEWGAASDELYFLSPDGATMAVSFVGSGSIFQASEPTKLFKADLDVGTYASYAAHPSGQRFAILEQASQFAPISLFLNWEEVLAGR